MDQLRCASLSHTHYWYEVGMLEVPAVRLHSWTFAVVPEDMAIHQVSTKHIIVHVFTLYAYMYVAPQDESCRYCYVLCRELLLFSLSLGDLV